MMIHDGLDRQEGLEGEKLRVLLRMKPIEERLLVTKVLFQLRLAKLPEPGAVSR